MPDLPLTLVVKRPDGVEYRRVWCPTRALGGRAPAAAAPVGREHGTWRVSAYTDPKAPAIGETSFLVEDYVPERLEVTLTARRAGPAPGRAGRGSTSPPATSTARRAPDLDVSGSVVVQAAASSGIKGLEGYAIGLDDEAVEPATQESRITPTTNAEGNAVVTVPVRGRRPARAGGEDHPGGRRARRPGPVAQPALPILPAGPSSPCARASRSSRTAAMRPSTWSSRQPRRRAPGRRVTWTLSRLDPPTNGTGRTGAGPSRRSRLPGASPAAPSTSRSPARPDRAPVGLGRYRLEVSTPGAPAATASSASRWAGGGETADVPDLLDLTLDKAAYAAGDTLRAKLSPKFKGQASRWWSATACTRPWSQRAGGRHHGEPAGEGRMGCRRLPGGHRLPAPRSGGQAPAGRALGLAWFSVDRERRSLGVA